MEIITDPGLLRRICWKWREQGLKIGLVPTMGYFHTGHISLMDWAAQRADKLVVTLFVNPTQFGPNEDLDAYPRDEERDRKIAEEHGAHLLFMPAPDAMYEPDHATWVTVPDLARNLCALDRPDHFRGVATVVAKLFMLTAPHVAVFGQKDWQQLAIIKRMARDLNMPVEVAGRPIVREEDGLAMSSRNAYLSPEERTQAPKLQAGLQQALQALQAGERDTARLKEIVLDYWKSNLPLGRPDYLEIVDPDSLEPVETVEESALAAAAVRLGKARLIDNLLLKKA